jgi:hypothetical protein
MFVFTQSLGHRLDAPLLPVRAATTDFPSLHATCVLVCYLPNVRFATRCDLEDTLTTYPSFYFP